MSNENLPAKRIEVGLDFSKPEVIATLRATVAAGTTDAEFAMFISRCQVTGLDPFKNEIWCIVVPEKEWTDYKTGEKRRRARKVQMMTGIAGFFAIANDEPNFDGHESGLIDPAGNYVTAAYPKNDWIGAWAKVYRKDRRIPTESVAMRVEYDKSEGNWKTMPRVMITKCAESVGLRKTFPQRLNGLYTAEEMPTEYGGGKPEIAPANGNREALPVKTADEIATPTIPTFPVGKYKDVPLSEVPANYLQRVFEDRRGYWEIAEQELIRRESIEMQEQGAKS